MRVLVEIVHPAHVHYFRPVLAALSERGHEWRVTARDKDCTLDLLAAYGIPHECLTRAARTPWGLAAELVERNRKLYGVVKAFQPHIILGKEAACAHQVACWTGTPSIAIDDTDDARLQRWLSLPFASVRCGDPRARLGSGFAPLAGLSPWMYLHPKRWVSPATASDRILLRLVRWTSSHDYGERGIPDTELSRLIEGLSSLGEVRISSERGLSPDLERRRLSTRPEGFHEVLAGCRLVVTESPTVAAEAVVLGVPAIYCGSRRLWYTESLGALGLLRAASSVEQILEQSEQAVVADGKRGREKLLEGCSDPLEGLFAVIESLGICGAATTQ